jgi:DNA primase
VSEAVKASLIARQGGPLKVKETEVCRLLLEVPELAARYAETLASLLFSDLALDRLRAELLNVAASGSRLEKQGLENHLIRCGMADIVARLKAPLREVGEGTASGEDADARFLRAASQLRDMAERDPERKRALERFKREPSEESWLEVRRLLEDRSGE